MSYTEYMIGGTQKNLDDRIIEYLAQGGKTAEDIHVFLSKEKSLTIQAVYSQLRSLIENRIIVKIKKNYVLSQEWIDRLNRLLTSSEAPVLEEGESIRYSFKSLKQLDSFWRHMLQVYFAQNLETPLCFYSHHYFWTYNYSREYNDAWYLDLFKKNKQPAFFLVGEETFLDYHFKKTYSAQHMKINCIRVKFIEPELHIVLIGDLVITTKMPDAFVKAVDDLYQKNIDNHDEVLEFLNQNNNTDTAVQVTIEKNQKKLKKYQKNILKDFALDKKTKEKFIF